MGSNSALLRRLFETAVAAVLPDNCMSDLVGNLPDGKIVVIGAGKAAAGMAAEIEKHKSAELSGLVIVPYGHAAACKHIDVVEAAHPIPDASGVVATRRILEIATGLTAADQVLCLLSGGGSSLMIAPVDGVTLADKQAITHALLKSGASISEINCVRKHLSAIKGGKLAAACRPARISTVIISDVPGNDVSLIASGPTVHDETASADALHVLQHYSIEVSESLRSVLENTVVVNSDFDEDVSIVATSDDAIAAAAKLAESAGYASLILGDLEGDARELATRHAALAMSIASGRGTASPPLIIFSGGETTVKLTGSGRGGRNTEYALALAIALDGHAKISAIACDTDGIDGSGDNAGCLVSPDTLKRASERSMDVHACQANNDSYHFFAALDDLVITGPTRTNVNDFRAILVER
ncbi:MAG: glycerate kinase [Proteobacteria bacterium]|nr:glycerate kinase [Pseudomonadota bacterium]